MQAETGVYLSFLLQLILQCPCLVKSKLIAEFLASTFWQVVILIPPRFILLALQGLRLPELHISVMVDNFQGVNLNCIFLDT